VYGQGLACVRATRRKALVDIALHPQVLNVLLESERQWCGLCKQEVVARDARSLPFTEYGLNVFLVVMILRFRSHASLAKIADVLAISHGLTISKASLCNLLAGVKRYPRGHYDQLITAVQAGKVMYADETGWLVNGQKAWMWLIASEEVTVYFAAESRGGGIARELYGESQALCMHDGYAAYTNALPESNHLYCWAHLLRFAHEETIVAPRLASRPDDPTVSTGLSSQKRGVGFWLTGLSTTAALMCENEGETKRRRKKWKCFPHSKIYAHGQII